MFCHLSEIDADDAADFFRQLISGEGLVDGSPVLALRRWLENRRMSRRGSHPVEAQANLIKAWNAYRRGARMSIVLWHPFSEAFPKAV